jgi:hypothetical protein
MLEAKRCTSTNAVPSMNRLNQTEPAPFSILRFCAFFRDSVFTYFMITSVLFVPCGGCENLPVHLRYEPLNGHYKEL